MNHCDNYVGICVFGSINTAGNGRNIDVFVRGVIVVVKQIHGIEVVIWQGHSVQAFCKTDESDFYAVNFSENNTAASGICRIGNVGSGMIDAGLVQEVNGGL